MGCSHLKDFYISSKSSGAISSLNHHVNVNSVNPDQLASSEASRSGSTLFKN